MDVKKIAQETHERNVAQRQDGGAGSGPKKGSGKPFSFLAEKRKGVKLEKQKAKNKRTIELLESGRKRKAGLKT